MTSSALRSAAKSSPVEHELVCPKGHQVELLGGGLTCGGPHGPDDDCSWEMKQLVRSGRTRPRQFTAGGKPEAFR